MSAVCFERRILAVQADQRDVAELLRLALESLVHVHVPGESKARQRSGDDERLVGGERGTPCGDPRYRQRARRKQQAAPIDDDVHGLSFLPLRPLGAQNEQAALSRRALRPVPPERSASAPSRSRTKPIAYDAGSELNFAIDYEME